MAQIKNISTAYAELVTGALDEEARFFLNSSHICSMVTHSTPSWLLMYSMSLFTTD